MFLAKIERSQGSKNARIFGVQTRKLKESYFWAALPGAQALTGFRPQRKQYTWLVQTYKEYFIEQTLGKSGREWLADFPKIFSQKRGLLEILFKDFGEKLSDSS